MRIDSTENAPFKIEGSTLMQWGDRKQEHIQIPQGVTRIAKNAFLRCKTIVSVEIPEGVTEIGDYAFQDCHALSFVKLPQSLIRIGKNAFAHCFTLEAPEFPDSLEKIDTGAFQSCIPFVGLDLPNELKYIGDEVFSHCEYLQELCFPDSLEELGSDIFRGCLRLTHCSLPSGLKKMPPDFFLDCSLLQCIKGGNKNTRMDGAAFHLNHIPEFVESHFLKGSPLSFQKEYCEIRFHSLPALKKQELIEMILESEDLQDALFRGESKTVIASLLERCQPLPLFDVDEYLHHSMKKAYGEITAIYLDYKNKRFTPEELQGYEQRIYDVALCLVVPNYKEFAKKWHCSLKNDMVTIHGYLGSGKTEIIPPVLADGMKIHDFHKKYLTSQELPQRYETLEELVVEADLLTLDFSVLPDGLKTFHVKGTVEKNYQISGLPEIEHLILPYCEEMTKIPSHQFEAHPSLRSIHLPNSITSIGELAFSECHSLQEIHLPDSLLEIESSGFFQCVALQKIHLPDSLRYIGKNTFSQCSSLKSVQIPDSVKTIDEFSFAACDSLTQVTMGNSVESIGFSTFDSCHKLRNVVLSPVLKEIPDSCFKSCGVLQELVIPEGVTTLGDGAFLFCEALTKVVLPHSLEIIERSAFPDNVNFCVYGFQGSYGEIYCKAHGIDFQVIPES